MGKNIFSAALIAALTILSGISCSRETSTSVIPQPQQLSSHSGTFDLCGVEIICDQAFDGRAANYVAMFKEELDAKVPSADKGGKMSFVLNPELGAEEYTLNIGKNGVEIGASALNGVVYAVQTLKQLIGLKWWKPEGVNEWKVPCLEMRDYPRFSYRGMHLDCARHFFSIEEVHKYIDIMVLHKMNRLHWHLTDDQGWRIEIPKYPRLTEVAAWRSGTMIGKNWDSDDQIPYGGYYTTEELREVVEYAAARGVTIVPEVDLPGHMQAVLAAYPQLGCTGGPYEVRKIWGVSDEVLCAGNDAIYSFIEDVLDQVMDIFPSEYIHIGGDECPKVRWECCPKCQAKIKALGLKSDEHFKAEEYLQSYVMNRVEKYLNDHGRKIIGWDEILEGNVSQSATIMSWRGAAGGIKAAQSGRDAIMTPNSYLYLDYCQSKVESDEPLCIGGYVPVDRVYSYEPYDDQMAPEQYKHILGVQANLWTEYIATDQHLEYMLLPRMSALSEVQWCMPEHKNWERFRNDMLRMREIYDAMGYSYATHMFDGRLEQEKEAATASGVKHKAKGRKAELLSNPHLNYRFKAPVELFDGLLGTDTYNSGAWIGWEAEPMAVVVEMGRASYESITMECLSAKGAYIFGPTWFKASVSSDGVEYTEIASKTYPAETDEDYDGIKQYRLDFPQTKGKYLKLEAGTLDQLPAWHPGAGAKAFLFVDEIIVK